MARQSTARRNRTSPERKSEPKSLGKLEHYSVSGLFGTRDIDFALDERAPTLLTGVNGTGKSTVLRTIDAISTGRWAALFEIPFSLLTLRFSSGAVLKAEQTPDEFRLSLSDEEPWRFPRATASPELKIVLDHLMFDRGVDWVLQAKDRGRSPEHLLLQYFIENSLLTARDLDMEPGLRAIRNSLVHRLPHLEAVPDWITTFSKRFPVLFVTDQRLVIEQRGSESSRRSEAVTTRVAAEEAARHIASEIEAAQAQYARQSQSLDRTSPKRVIGAMSQPVQVGEEDLQTELAELSQLRQSLQRSGLLPRDVTEEFEDLNLTAPHVRAYVATYVGDMHRKLSVLEPLRRRLALFTEFLSQHYRNKTVAVDQQSGFLITVEEQDVPVAPARLSSGEQQILVLAHHILFRATPGTLVLIDEPELSLHVVWQATLVEDLTEMGKERDLSFLLATHSPTLLAGREDLKRSLDG